MNFIGLKTFYLKNVIRFFRVYNQTIIAPIINAVLFFFIFTIAFDHNISIGIVPYSILLTSGLIIMSTINSAYNDGIIIVVTKITGNIIDLVTAPLTPNQILIGSTAASITRAFIVTILAYTVLSVMQMHFSMHNIFIILFYVFIGSLISAIVGTICGLLCDNFEQTSLITNYIMTPLMFLSGTFYSIKKLPIVIQKVIMTINPFFYIIDGFRYGISGYKDGSLIQGSIFLIFVSCVLWFCAFLILKNGYKIRK